MKANIQGINVTGTPEEIAELIELTSFKTSIEILDKGDYNIGDSFSVIDSHSYGSLKGTLAEGQDIAFEGFSEDISNSVFTIININPSNFGGIDLSLKRKR